MNKTLKKVLIFFPSLFLLIVLGGFMLPTEWKVERVQIMEASPDMIYPFVANLKDGWPKWSSFDKQDPNIVYSYNGPALGPGATRSWVSKSMGNGSQTITFSDPQKGVSFELKMENNFNINGKIQFEPSPNGTKVTWTDWGDTGKNPLFRYMGMAMDSMMGDTFEESLRKLKSLVETNVTKP